MESFFKKIEEYNILNYLLPGVIFTYLLKFYVEIDLFQDNIFEMIFIYYFVGSLVSRLGSLFLEKILKKIKYIKYTPYEDYMEASKKDSLIKTLSMNNNMYRTFCAGFIVILLLRLIKLVIDYFKIPQNIFYTLLVILCIITYCLSYKKQTQYIVKRVNYVQNDKQKIKMKD